MPSKFEEGLSFNTAPNLCESIDDPKNCPTLPEVSDLLQETSDKLSAVQNLENTEEDGLFLAIDIDKSNSGLETIKAIVYAICGDAEKLQYKKFEKGLHMAGEVELLKKVADTLHSRAWQKDMELLSRMTDYLNKNCY